MIKFFRKIRQNLLSEGKTRKYFKYAIGEILLVVIGILIALGINNWNENRKFKNVEKNVLTNIYKNLGTDSIQFKYYTQQFKQIEKLHLELFKVGVDNKSLDSISEPTLIRRSLYFKQLINSGFGEKAETINNTKIKEALITYTRSIDDMESIYLGQLTPLIENKLKPLLAEEKLYNTENWFYLKDKNFEDYSYKQLNGKNLLDKNGLIQLAKTDKFQQLLFEINVKWNDFYTRIKIVIEENNSLRNLIKSELKNY
ncbi:DUF6090 family protein [Winogradskyella sp. PG-2]|uniref:DUF6090 family protein n=1 Tax=Winogradskyella sp. PG-2 TaxID=754409 RepID=UPI0004585E28|nr:DUF6090 family protein [Winogradskyella sp. PG-2]BAO76435.1 hypothetical protein WPG_2205 [Winogradskyella sp. PG-2]